MTDSSNFPDGWLRPDEEVRIEAHGNGARIVVTDDRVGIATSARHLVLTYEHLRRVEFDIERERPATLVFVPDRPSDPPQVVSIPPAQYHAIALALAIIGQRLAQLPATGAGAAD